MRVGHVLKLTQLSLTTGVGERVEQMAVDYRRFTPTETLFVHRLGQTLLLSNDFRCGTHAAAAAIAFVSQKLRDYNFALPT